MPNRKIATCCYCGTRAMLVLTGNDRQELSCASCGAPLHDLKRLRSDHGDRRPGLVKPSRVRRVPTPRPDRLPPPHLRRKSLRRKLFEEAWDIIEDIFD